MKYAAIGGIELAAAPDKLSGLIKIKPGSEKGAKKSRNELVCVTKIGSNSFVSYY